MTFFLCSADERNSYRFAWFALLMLLINELEISLIQDVKEAI